MARKMRKMAWKMEKMARKWFENGISCLVPSTFFRPIFGHSWGLVHGEGGAPGTVPLRNLRVTSHLHHRDMPLGWYQVCFFGIILEHF